jgi:hypothetical protein
VTAVRIEERIPLLEEVLDGWSRELGDDYQGYRNHVYRMVHFCFALHDCDAEEREKILVAGCFHDLGIWARGTFDYLPPSIALAKEYLSARGLDGWSPEIERMIDLHHKLRRVRDERHPLVEVFRRGDLVDFSLGLVRCGLPRRLVAEVKHRFPNAGFHKRLVRLAGGWIRRHPLNPLPVVKL